MNGSVRSIAVLYDVAFPFVEGGGQRRLYEVARRLARRGHVVHWYALKTWDGPSVQERDGITYFGLDGRTALYSNDGKRSLSAAISYGNAILKARTSFHQYDLVWCGQWPLFHHFALLARLVPFRTRILVDWWEVWGSHWLEYGGLKGFGGWAMEIMLANLLTRIGHTVTISQQGTRALVRLGAARSGITYIPNGIDTTVIDAIPAAPGSSDIIYFGRLNQHKNVDHLIRAIAHIRDTSAQELIADIIGDGPERESLQSLSNSLNLQSQITFHGRVSDQVLIGLLKRSKVFVHPSTKEGGGSITLLEANACGLPAAFYSHPLGIDPDQLIEGRTGLIASPVDPVALAKAILHLLSRCKTDPVAQWCREHARLHDWEVLASKYSDLIDNL